MVDDSLDWAARGVVPTVAPQPISSSEELAFTTDLRRSLRRHDTAAVIKEALVSFLLNRPFVRSERLRCAQRAVLENYLESDCPDLVSLLYERI
jgi:hypothetical protein